MKQHIEYLIKSESQIETSLMWDRIDSSTIWVSTVGYVHQDLKDLEAALLKLGCRYDLKRGVQKFDKISGRTFTYFKEPKN